MTKEQKKELEKQGFIILRGQWIKKGWHVVKKTSKGGWEAIDLNYYPSIEPCDKAIMELIAKWPGKYVFDK